MTANEFAMRAKSIAQHEKTVYMKGVFGAPVTEKILKSKQKQYPEWYHEKRMAALSAHVGKKVFGFDCVCLIKAILWGFTADETLPWGGAVYRANGVGDFSVSGMQKHLTEKSSDFSHLAVGEVVTMPDHCGIYIGDGLCVEATTAFGGGVVLSACNTEKEGYPTRYWTVHGKLDYVEYPETEFELPTLRPWDVGEAVRALQALINLRTNARLDTDASFGPMTKEAVLRLQDRLGLERDGVVDGALWMALIRESAR